ncbi:DnaD domain protein [Brevibacillus sp. SYP-B805]|uniref:DnaD domain protein n=1 Tax=Brevibacillus sp. SYP-B805 TaxID=1578199 RepID=UPI0013EC2C87|nr:DnaD domain protein [Brevibacillus sp. SYP-B805]NGQ95040.1 DnaD domain protein [Brevibacillus sp. SYP-B805]
MNYLEQIVAFHRWKEVNPLPASAIALWYELMAICNKAGWPQEFTVPNAVLQSYAGLSRKEFERARQQLIDLGLITYKKATRVNQAGKYSINYFPIVQKGQREGQQEGQQQGQREEHRRGTGRGTLYKQKLNNILLPHPVHASEVDPVLLYQQEIGPFTDVIRDDFLDWLDGGYFDEPNLIMIEAIKEAAVHEKRSWAYIVTVLRRCLQQNVRTLEQFRQAKAEFEKTKAAKVTPIHSGRRQAAANGEPTWQDDPPKSHYGRLEV